MTSPMPDSAPHLVITVGRPARDFAAGLCRRGDRHRALTDADDVGAVLDLELARLTTGWRVLAVGTERDTRIVRAAALARGALDDEVTVLTPDDDGEGDDGAGHRRVHCAHCHHRFDTGAAVGDVVVCPGCGEPLAIAAHHSRTHGAVLGVPTVR